MAQQIINVGNVANDGQGDPIRTAFIKSNENFTELYNAGGITGIQNGTSNITIANNSTIKMAVSSVPNVVVVSSSAVTVSGNVIGDSLTATGNILADYYIGNGSLLTGLSTQSANSLIGTTLAATVVNSSLTKIGTLSTLSVSGNINSGGNLNLSSNVKAANVASDGVLTVVQSGSFGFGITVGGTVSAVGGVSTAGNVSAVGNIVGNNITGTNVFSTGLLVVSQLATDPPGVTGAIYFNTGNSKFRGFDGSTWQDLN